MGRLSIAITADDRDPSAILHEQLGTSTAADVYVSCARGQCRQSTLAEATAAVIAALAAAPRPAIRRFTFHEELGDREPPCTHAASGLLDCLPNLEQLQLSAQRPMLHELRHPGLARLAVRVDPLCAAGQWELPALRALDWDPTIEGDCGFDVFDVLWKQELPALRELALRGRLITGEPTLDRHDVRDFIMPLERVSIPLAGLIPYDQRNDDLADHLIERAAWLRHLPHLTIYGLGVRRAAERDGVARLHEALPNVELLASRELPSIVT